MKKIVGLAVIFYTINVYAQMDSLCRRFINDIHSPNYENDGKFGVSIASLEGDVNHDGYDDFIVGASWEDPGSNLANSGMAYVLSGKDGSMIYHLESPNPQAAGLFGANVGSLGGDIDGDNIFDIMVQAAGEEDNTSNNFAGLVYIFSGADGRFISKISSPNERSSGNFGGSLIAMNADINDDGIVDFLIGAINENFNKGIVYLYSGKNQELIYSLQVEDAGAFGTSICVPGDLNGDDINDIVVGAPLSKVGSTDRAGKVYSFSGRDGAIIDSYITTTPVMHQRIGTSVIPYDDLNGDNIPEIVVGAPGTTNGVGRILVLDGANLTRMMTSDVSVSKSLLGEKIINLNEDVDEDGHTEFIVSARYKEADSMPAVGSVYIMSFENTDSIVIGSSLRIVSPNLNDNEFSNSLCPLGNDINGDNKKDFIIGAVRHDYNLNTDAGMIYMVSSKLFPEYTINTGDDVTVCGADSILIEVLNYPNISYQWIKDGVDISNATSAHYYAKENGLYTIHISNECQDTILEGIEVNLAPSYDQPEIQLIDDSVIMFLNPEEFGGRFSVEWILESKNQERVVWEEAISYLPLEEGKYKIMIMTEEGCLFESNVIEYKKKGKDPKDPERPETPSVGVQEKFSERIGIYPNPAKDFIQINIDKQMIQNNLSIHMLSQTGQVVKFLDMSDNLVDVSDLSSGLYMLEWSNLNDEIIRVKFVKY